MNETDFLNNYLWPADDRLDRTYTNILPNIEGLQKRGDFIVQSRLEDTFSTNIIAKYESDALGVRLVEVYKNTHNEGNSLFIRLVGTMSLVKIGYPFVILDASVRNVAKLAAEREDIATRVAIHLPQADTEQRQIFFPRLKEQAQASGIYYGDLETESSPDFWGTVWLGEANGVDLDMIRQVRDYAWNSYKGVIEQTKEKTLFDYRPVQEEMIFSAARREQLSFRRRGLSIPVEVQAAFFSVLVSGV